MGECYNCTDLEKRIDNLRRNYDHLRNEYNKLQEKYDNTYNKLSSANFKIETELEPRIKQEQRSYDVYVTNGGGDECFQSGISGSCGYDCHIFGEKPECFENVKREEILYIYENITDTGYIEDLIEEYELEAEAKEIDRGVLRKQIDKHQEEIAKLQQQILKI